jgi:hypothetical protein
LPVTARTPSGQSERPGWLKRPLYVSVQRSQHANARHHGRAAELDDQEQGFDRGLPLLEQLLGLRQLYDVVGGVAQSLTSSRPSGSRTGSSKGRAHAATGFNCAIGYPPSGMCRALNWRSFLRPLRLPHFLGRLFCFPEPLTELVQFGDLNKEIGRITGEN